MLSQSVRRAGGVTGVVRSAIVPRMLCVTQLMANVSVLLVARDVTAAGLAPLDTMVWAANR